MTFTHEDANARLLDLVYGEAPPAEREALQAHIATCTSCQAELEALGDTRARVRVALDDQPAPAGAHARILAAAAAEVSNGAQAGAAATAPPAKGNEPASRAARAEEQPSFWERLRRKWTLPTLATVGAFAVAMLVLGPKMFTSPEKVMERGQEDLFPKDEAKPEAEAHAKYAEPSPAKLAAAAPPPAETIPSEPEADKAREISPQMRARIESIRRYNNKPRSNLGDLLNKQPSFKADRLGAPASQAIGGLRADDFGGGAGVGRGAMGGSTAGPAATAKKHAKGGHEDPFAEEAPAPARDDRYASPPAGWKSAPPAPAKPAASPAPAPMVAKKKAVADDMLDGLTPRASSAPARAEAESGEVLAEGAAERRKAAPAAPKAEPAPPPPAPVAASGAGKATERSADEKKEKDAAAPYEALAKRADELYAAQRWSEAAVAYNELVRRFPNAEAAALARWRARMAVAQRSAAPKDAPAAKAASKKATSDSPAAATSAPSQ